MDDLNRPSSNREAAYSSGAHDQALVGFEALRAQGLGNEADLAREIGLLARSRRTEDLFRLAVAHFEVLRTARDGLNLVAVALRAPSTIPAKERVAFFRIALEAEPRNAEVLARLVEALLAAEDMVGARQVLAHATSWAEPAALAHLRSLIAQAAGDLPIALREAALALRLTEEAGRLLPLAQRQLFQVSTALAYAIRADVAREDCAAAQDKLRLLRECGRYGREQLSIELQLLNRARQREAFRQLLAEQRELAVQSPDSARRIALLARNYLTPAERADFLREAHALAPADVPLLEALLRVLLEAGDAAGGRSLMQSLGSKGPPEAERAALVAILPAAAKPEDPATPVGQIAIFRRRIAAGEGDAAAADLIAFLQREPDAGAVRRELVDYLNPQRRYVEAARLIDLERIAGEPTKLLINWAITLFRGHQYERGAELLARIEARDGETPELAMARISALEMQGDLQGAAAIARERHAKVKTVSLLRLMADQASRLNRFDEARRLLDACDEAEPGDRNTDELRRRNERMEAQQQAWIAEARAVADHLGATPGEELLLGDYFAQFGMVQQASAAYERAVKRREQGRSRGRRRAADPVPPLARAQRIVLLAEAARFDEALALFERLNLSQVDMPTLLRLERAVMRRTLNPRFAVASAQLRAEFGRRSVPSSIRRIAIVGGSNTIMTSGWGRTLEALGERALGLTVHNYGIGASSCLYGWLRIGKDSLFERYDLVLFEHALNDAVYVQNGSMDHGFRRSVLRAIAQECAAKGGRFAMLLTAPRENAEAAINGVDPIIEETRRFCAEAGIDADDPSARMRKLRLPPGAARFGYRDELHYTEAASTDMAVNLLARIATEPAFGMVRHVPPAWADQPGALRSISVAGLEHMKVTGPHKVQHLESAFYSGDFVRLERGARLTTQVGGRLVGLLVNVSADTGHIRVRIGDRVFVKNLFGFRNTNDPTKPRILLRQFETELRLAPGTPVEIDLDLGPADLQKLPHDQTAYASAPQVPLEAQVLEIGGLILC
ncbi:hypothetical protein [Sediminicoccus rosea]|uniref:SGNH hydrolase-type esterase domain-containing protein n=1 Tax=Sediminicoccus rosea TaxID=1225128 RepID=A0ABZ0PQA0_9PROT|nr:hypothetical protein [Sediminicoccus rosea]WPB87443.1 hypothetical protein R9Z33_11285 [Sediminicoccus rosea]